ncbi:MAG: 30S ribosome-binding factor RbfA [Ignavibacteria bacterium]|nr:30S ribosome-binding factor RbfA [Ignavibacteria bacterium]
MAYRTEKVAEEIKHKINTAMSKDLTELNLGLVTVSKVVMSGDLKLAKVYLTIIGNKEPADKCIDRLNFRKKHIRYLLAKNIKLKYIPELNFYYDDTLEYADKINKLLKEINPDHDSKTGQFNE